MTSLLNMPAFDLVALAASSGILSLAAALVHARIAQALEGPYRLRGTRRDPRPELRLMTGAARAPRAARRHFAERELDLCSAP